MHDSSCCNKLQSGNQHDRASLPHCPSSISGSHHDGHAPACCGCSRRSPNSPRLLPTASALHPLADQHDSVNVPHAPLQCVQSPAYSPSSSHISSPSSSACLFFTAPPDSHTLSGLPQPQHPSDTSKSPPEFEATSPLSRTAPPAPSAIPTSAPPAAQARHPHSQHAPQHLMLATSAGPAPAFHQQHLLGNVPSRPQSAPRAPASAPSKRAVPPCEARRADKHAHGYALAVYPCSHSRSHPTYSAHSSSASRPQQAVRSGSQASQHPSKRAGGASQPPPVALKPYCAVSASRASLLTHGRPASGTEAASRSSTAHRESASAHHAHTMGDVTVQQRGYTAKQDLKQRKALWSAWALQVVVLALLMGTILAVPQHRSRVIKQQQAGPSDWIAGSLPGFLAALLLPTLFVLCYLWYVQQCYHTCTADRLQHVNRSVSLEDYLHHLRACKPTVAFSATCYHYESEARYEGGARHMHTAAVVTHEARQELAFRSGHWLDATSELSADADKLMTHLQLSDELELSDAAREKYFAEFNEFCRRNHFDVCQDYRRVLVLEGFKENQTFFRDARHPPWWVNTTVYWLTAVLLLNVPFRLWLEAQTGAARLCITKRIEL